MPEIKHTPGPFTFTDFTGADGREGYAILSQSPEVGRGYGVLWVEKGEMPNPEGDGPLFAAAPDMLEALKMFVSEWDGDQSPPKKVRIGRAVIARATGKGE